MADFEKKFWGPAPAQAHWAQVQSGQGRVQILVKAWGLKGLLENDFPLKNRHYFGKF